MSEILRLIRPKHWCKNSFVFAPLIFSFDLIDQTIIFNNVLVFIAFSLAASSAYIVNDICDKQSDQNHPIKKTRPIAFGTISIPQAIFIGLFLLTFALIIADSLNTKTLEIIIFYLILNLGYSIKFKNIIFFDVFIIAFGFILRIYAGAYATSLNISKWLILCAFFITLFLGFGKRLREYILLSKNSKNLKNRRSVLNFYSESLLTFLILSSLFFTILMYSLYTLATPNKLIYTIPLVLTGTLRYLFLLYSSNIQEDVAEIIFEDKIIKVTIIIWVLYVACSF